MLVQLFVVHLGNEHRVVIKKMDFLLVAHGNVRVPAQEIMQRRRPGFLRPGQNEIQTLNLFGLGTPHNLNQELPIAPRNPPLFQSEKPYHLKMSIFL